MALRFVVFFLVVLSIVVGVHYYFWARFVRDTQLPAPIRPWATALVVGLAVSLPTSLLLMRRLPPAWSKLVAWPAFVWMGLMLFLLLGLAGADLLKLVARLAQGAPVDPVRRSLIARWLGGTVGLLAGGLGGFALARGLAPVVVKEVKVRLQRLPRASNGTVIAQLTDVHIGPTIGRGFLEEVVRQTNALDPDLVVITGDLVDGSVEDLWPSVAPLAGLRARHGVYFVTGNHEFFSGVGAWVEALPRLGIRVLANQRVAVGAGDGGFDLAGIHDHSGGRLDAAHAPDLPTALAGRDPSRELVLLAHQPVAVREAARHGVGLQLSGHTHGGQLWPFKYLVQLAQPYVEGLHRQGETQIYVSPGTGYWGPPMRLGTRAEITKIVLESSPA